MSSAVPEFILLEEKRMAGNRICTYLISANLDMSDPPEAMDAAGPGSRVFSADQTAQYMKDLDGTWVSMLPSEEAQQNDEEP